MICRSTSKRGVEDNFQNSRTIIDKFHVIKYANEAVDAVRKDESKENPLLYDQASDRPTAEARLSKQCTWMKHSRLADMKKRCRLIKDHWNEILNYFDYKFTYAILEGMNSIIQNVKRRARGFRNTEYFKTMIYLNCSDLDIEAVIAMA